MYIKIYNLTVRRINLVMLNSFVSLNQFFIESDNKNNNNNNNNNNKNKNKKKVGWFFFKHKKKCSGIANIFSKRKNLIMNLKFDTYQMIFFYKNIEITIYLIDLNKSKLINYIYDPRYKTVITS